MDRFLEQYDRKFIRKVMLKHEDIFKQQVHELHRLYRVQKMLMAEMDMKLKSLPNTATTTAVTDSRTRFGSSTSTSETSQSSKVSLRHHPAAQLNSNYSALPRCTMMIPQEAEDPLRTVKSFNLELSSEENLDPGVGTTQDKISLLRKNFKQTMSNKGRDMWTDGEIDVELTLSIGCGFSEKKPRQWFDPNIGLGYSKSAPTENRKILLSTPVKPERGEECSDPTAGFDGESLQRPSWLLQALSLNRN